MKTPESYVLLRPGMIGECSLHPGWQEDPEKATLEGGNQCSRCHGAQLLGAQPLGTVLKPGLYGHKKLG
jgi:hypothetical protein